MQSDGFSGYEKIGTPQLIRAGCMAHARRKFTDLLKIDPKNKEAQKVLQQIAKLYEIEAKAREEKYSPQQRQQQRQTQSLPLMEELKKQLIEIRERELPANMLAKACNYALNQWEKLTTFLDHGIVKIDQNLCENGMRPLALGRKNWLHIGSEKAGPKIAAILSIFETCKRLKINIRDYLNEVLPKLGKWIRPNVAELTPDRCFASKTAL